MGEQVTFHVYPDRPMGEQGTLHVNPGPTNGGTGNTPRLSRPDQWGNR
jgi:hypothetical protein